MAAGGSHLDGALGVKLAFHVAEVDRVVAGLCQQFHRTDDSSPELARLVDQVQHLGQRAQSVDLDFLHHRCLGRVVHRHHQPANSLLARHAGDGKSSLDRAQTSVKRKFAKKHELPQVAFEQDARSTQDAECDREVKPGAFLLHVRRRQVHGDVLKGKLEAAVLDGGFDALPALAHGGVGQADGHEIGVARRDVNLHLDQISVNSEDSGAEGFEEHGRVFPRDLKTLLRRSANVGRPACQARIIAESVHTQRSSHMSYQRDAI